MSVAVDTPKTEEPVPVSKPVESTSAAAQETIPTTSEIPTETGPMGTMEPETTAATTTGTEATTKSEAVVEATPATEGVLAYKAPGLLNLLRKNKYFFWFSEEPLTQDALDSYVKNEKTEAHHNAAWAQETGKGVLFYAKRAEDKATPSGMILLPEATAVTKVGSTDFSFKTGSHTHKFEASTAAERDSWVVAIQKIVDDSAHLKSEITGRESYKKTVEGYSSTPVIAGSASKATAPKKSLDAATATEAATSEPTAVPATEASSASSVDDAKKAKKERSQSRKRSSVFGLFGKKDEETAAKQAEKEHEKEVKKAEKEQEKEAKKVEKEHVKEEKKHEAEVKKEEAKAEHDATKAKEAAEAAAAAAAPAAVVSAEKKHEEKPTEEVTSPSTDKKNKRSSVFGGFFNKNKVASPTTEKAEKDVLPEVSAKDESPVVSETAPKLDEPIETKPIDAAAVTAPVDTIATPAAPAQIDTTETKAAEPTPAVEATTTPRTEKKSFLAGVFKKSEKKEEPKEEVKTNEEAVKEVAPVTSEPAAVAAEPTTETPATETEVAKEERPAREKRRTSLFGSLGTLKRKTDKSPEPSSVTAADGTTTSAPRSKSPIPRLGGLFRKPSRATKPETTADEAKTETVAETAAAPAAADNAAHTTIVEPHGNSTIVGDVVPENLTSTTIHDAVTTDPKEVKATA